MSKIDFFYKLGYQLVKHADDSDDWLLPVLAGGLGIGGLAGSYTAPHFISPESAAENIAAKTIAGHWDDEVLKEVAKNIKENLTSEIKAGKRLHRGPKAFREAVKKELANTITQKGWLTDEIPKYIKTKGGLVGSLAGAGLGLTGYGIYRAARKKSTKEKLKDLLGL